MPGSPALPLIADRYAVVRTLGQGAFGRTLLARDGIAGRQVAIKVLETRKVDAWKAFELFEREAAVLRSVRHHGVPAIYDSLKAPWEEGEAAFLVMEYVEGSSLEALIGQRHHLDPAEASHILLELLGVLDYLHSRVPPILHRDIKPANIILRPDGYPTLVDFGAVRSAIAAPGQDGSTIVGTYGYMPYEQHMGQATPSSDLYALAATFLHLATGRPPPEFLNPEGRVAVPESLPGGDRLRQVLGRMLDPSPAARFQTAREVRQALLATDPEPGSAAGRSLVLGATRQISAPPDLAPAPRPLIGKAAERFHRLAPSLWRYQNASGDPMGGEGLGGVLAAVFIGFVTFGILPAVVAGMALTRRRRLKRFFEDGRPGVAEITSIEGERDSLGVRMGRVRFQFEVDGQLHRGSDTVLQRIADRWGPGDQIEILYLPEADYDGIIVSVR